ncbi:uncharacterized protein LOC134256202 [Saccostrea cucullata]|uniref:uncharacterized protein LOC134256202 n=1 Tax=Saccostrea cuccullata TaxID=36930 RepID=UPI002ED2211C
MEAKSNSDKPWLFAEDLEMSQMVFEDIVDRVEEELSTKKILDNLMARAKENMETQHLNMKLDKPGLFVEDLEMCQMVLGEILDRVEQENSTKETLDDMDTAKQRNEILKILKVDTPWCAVVEEDKRIQENMETKHLNMKLDKPRLFVEDLEMCQMVLGEILDRVEENSTKEIFDDLDTAKQRNEILKILKIDKSLCAVGEEDERLQENMENKHLNMKLDESCFFVEDFEMCQMVLGEILDRVEEENMYSTKETMDGLTSAKENIETKHLKIKLDEPCLFVEDLGTCQESDKISMKFEKAWRVDDEEKVKDIIDNLLERTEEEIERKRMKTLMMKVLEELKLKVPIVLSVSYPPEVADHANLKELTETKQESKYHKSRNNDKNMADAILGRAERQCKMKKNLDDSHDFVNDLTGKDEKSKILKLDKTCHVKDEQIVEGIINNLMGRVGEEIDRKRIRKLMANVQEEFKSRVSIIHKHAYSMESYSQKINFENVQNNKLHYIGSERKEFCQLKVPIVLSVSYPSEVADHENMKELIETKQESKSHKSRNNDKNMADAILDIVERQCNMKKNLDDLTGKDEKSQILIFDKALHVEDEQMLKDKRRCIFM